MRRREQGRVLGILVVLVLLAAIGVGGWYFFIYMKSPQYALNQFLDAAKAGDTERVNRYADATGPILGFISMASMAMGGSLADPVTLIFPGYKSAEFGQTQAYEVKSLSVEGETARAQIALKVATPGGEVTLNPTYVLRKVEGQWKVAVEPTLAGSFNEFVPNAMRQQLIRRIRQLAGNPMVQSMVAPQINSLRSEIEKYPQLRDFLKSAGLL